MNIDEDNLQLSPENESTFNQICYSHSQGRGDQNNISAQGVQQNYFKESGGVNP